MPIPAKILNFYLEIKGSRLGVFAGDCMYPALKENYKVKVDWSIPENTDTGDIAIFARSGKLVCHRVIAKIRILKSTYFLEKGDNSSSALLVNGKELVGKVSGVLDERGREISERLWSRQYFDINKITFSYKAASLLKSSFYMLKRKIFRLIKRASGLKEAGKRALSVFSLILFTVLFLPYCVFAETIVFKSGKKAEGSIQEYSDKFIKIDQGIGIPLTYFVDEIDTINGENIEAFLAKKATAAQENYLYFFKKGILSGLAENFAQAAEEFSQALKLSNHHYFSRMALKITNDARNKLIGRECALALFKALNLSIDKEYGQVKEELLKCEKINGDYPELIFFLGYSYYALGEIQEALTYFNKARQIGSEEADFYIYLGIIYRELNQAQEARECFLKARELCQNSNNDGFIQVIDDYLKEP